MDSHSSPSVFRLPARLDPKAGALTCTLSKRAPVACTATGDVGSWLVAPFKGTVVTSASNCTRVSAVVVLARTGVDRLWAEPFIVATPTTTPATTIAPRAPVATRTAVAGRRRPEGERPCRGASPLIVMEPTSLLLVSGGAPGALSACL